MALEAALADRDAGLAATVRELEAYRSRVGELDLVSDRLSDLVVARDKELREARTLLVLLAGTRVGSQAVEPPAQAEPEAVEVVGAARVAEDVFVGEVELEVGPLSDFAQLVGFEDAAGGIEATREISVKRFAGGRATLEMRLGEPVELLRELEERAPFEFRVRDLRADRLVLDVEDE
jgi:hypothetical protein